MIRFLFALAVGVAVGYQVGWMDHERNDAHVLARLKAKADSAARRVTKGTLDSLDALSAQTDSAMKRVTPPTSR